jgi:hypothetical protein
MPRSHVWEWGANGVVASINVTCTDGSTLTGFIDYDPVLNTGPAGSQFYTGTGTLHGSVNQVCSNLGYDPNNTPISCNNLPLGSQGHWFIDEGWQSSNGQSGYACQAGPTYPSSNCTDD